MIVLDTNIVIYYLQDNLKVVRSLNKYREREESFAISTISVTELLSFPHLTTEEFFAIEKWFQFVHMVPVDMVIAKEAAGLRREYRITTTDAIIAATAMIVDGTLLTNDRRLLKIKEARVLPVY